MKAYTYPAGNPPEVVGKLRALVAGTLGRFFTVAFVPRKKGREGRVMRARLKRLKPGTVERDRFHHLFTVWDIEKGAPRCVPLERIVYFRCGGEEFVG